MSYNRCNTNGFSAERGSSLADDLELLCDSLCRHWGFCNRLSGGDLLSDGGVTAAAFADQILVAEELDPEVHPEHQNSIRKAFVERFGTDKVSVEAYSNSTIT